METSIVTCGLSRQEVLALRPDVPLVDGRCNNWAMRNGAEVRCGIALSLHPNNELSRDAVGDLSLERIQKDLEMQRKISEMQQLEIQSSKKTIDAQGKLIEALEVSRRISNDPRLFFFSPVIRSKNGLHSKASKYHSTKYPNCVFCGSDKDVTLAHLISEVQDGDGVSLAVFNRPVYVEDLDVKSPRNFLRLCGTKGVLGTCHDAFDYFRLSLIYDPANQNYIIYAVDRASVLHLKRITLSSEMPPYKRLLCWRFRKSIEIFGGLPSYEHLPKMLDIADFSEAGSVISAGESKDEDVSVSDV